MEMCSMCCCRRRDACKIIHTGRAHPPGFLRKLEFIVLSSAEGAYLPPGGRWIFRPDKGGTKKTEEEFGRITPDTGNRSDLLTGYDFKSLMHFLVPRLTPAFLFSQKSKIFDSFPPGEALAACGRKQRDKQKFEYCNQKRPGQTAGALLPYSIAA